MKLIDIYVKTGLLLDDIYGRYDFIKNRLDALIYLLVSTKTINSMDIDRLTKFVEESKKDANK